jgi:hypothetical protein
MVGWEDPETTGDQLQAERMRRASRAVELAGPSGLVAAFFHVDTARPGHDEVQTSELLDALHQGFRFDRGMADHVFPEAARTRFADTLAGMSPSATITVLRLLSSDGSDITLGAGEGLLVRIARGVACRPGRAGVEVAYSLDVRCEGRMPEGMEEMAVAVALASLARCDMDAVYDSLDTRMRGVSVAIVTPQGSLCAAVISALLEGERERVDGKPRLLQVVSRLDSEEA